MGTLHDDHYAFISVSVLLRMRSFSDESCRENRNQNFMCSDFISKFVPFVKYCEQYCRAGQVTDDNMAHSHHMLYY